MKLKEFVDREHIELIIWDLDGVIYDLDWFYPESPDVFLEKLYSKINAIDRSVIIDRAEFFSRRFPYPEINQIGIKYGKDIQLEVKSLYLDREMSAVDRAIPHLDVLDIIKSISLPQIIWSNNYINTIEYLLKKGGIEDKIEYIVSLDKVILSKPDIEGFKLIQDHYPDIKKEHMLLVGDSLISDKVAASVCGIKFYQYIKH